MVVSVVAAYSNPPSKAGWLFLMPVPNAYLAGNSKGRSVVAAGLGTGSVSSTTDGWNDGALHVFTLCSPQGLRVDGQQWSNWGPDPFGQDVIMIGGQIVPGPDGGPAPIDGPLDGYVAEVIMAKYASCTPTVVAQLNAYFQAKYGVPF